MDQERYPRMQPLTAPPPLFPQPASIHQGILATPAPSHLRQFGCTLPVFPPPILTPSMPQACTGIRPSMQPSSSFMLLSAFQGKQVKKIKTDQISEHLQDTYQPRQVAVNDPPARTVTFEGSYHVFTPSTSKDDVLEVIQNHW